MFNKIFEQFKNDKLYEGEDTGGTGDLGEEVEEIVEEGEENKTVEEGEEEEIVEEEKKDDEDKTEKDKTKKDDKDDTTDEQKKDSVVKQALTKYPKVFKDFPELRSAYFENKQFKEVFTSVDEAKEAIENSNILQKISGELQSGNPKEIIEYLKSEPKTLTQFTRNLIKDLPKEVFSDAIAPSIIEMLKEVKEAAKLHKNEDLENSVGWISKYLFNNHELPTIKDAEKKEEKPEDNKLLTQVEKNFNEEVTEEVINDLNSTIEISLASLKNVKPAIRKSIISEIKDELDKLAKADTAQQKLMSKLWKDAKGSNYSRQSKASIKSAFLAAVKKRLPEVRTTVLKNNGYVIKKGQKQVNTEEKAPTFTKNGNTPSNTSSQDDKVAKLKKEGKSEREILDALTK